MTLKVLNEGYVASKFERLFEEKLTSYFKNNGIEFVKMVKFGHDENSPEFELKYDVYIKHTDEKNISKLEEEFGLIYACSSDGCDVLSYSFLWCTSEGDLGEDCDWILATIGATVGAPIDQDLHEDTMEYLSKGILWGELELITP